MIQPPEAVPGALEERPPTVLVVDDAPGNLNLLDAILGDSGYRVATSGSGATPMPMGLACCAIEMIATTMARYDMARFGAEIFKDTTHNLPGVPKSRRFPEQDLKGRRIEYPTRPENGKAGVVAPGVVSPANRPRSEAGPCPGKAADGNRCSPQVRPRSDRAVQSDDVGLQ